MRVVADIGIYLQDEGVCEDDVTVRDTNIRMKLAGKISSSVIRFNSWGTRTMNRNNACLLERAFLFLENGVWDLDPVGSRIISRIWKGS